MSPFDVKSLLGCEPMMWHQGIEKKNSLIRIISECF
jgi:hypothetical protein